MGRLKAWSGTEWKDVRVWDGSAWRAYQPAVYGAAAYDEPFNAIPPYWRGEGYSGKTLQNWNNIHVYCDGDDVAYESLAIYITGQDTATTPVPLAAFKTRPGQTVRAQASVLIQKLTNNGASAYSGKLSLKAHVIVPSVSAYQSILTSGVILTGDGNWGWGVLTTDAYTIPATGLDEPVDVTLDRIVAEYWHESPALPSFANTYRMFLDWVRLIDQDGNVLQRKTVDPVHALKVWNGSAWV